MSMFPGKSRTVTLTIGEHAYAAFMRHVAAFNDTDETGRPKWHAGAEARADERDEAMNALATLLQVAEHGEGASAEAVARLLAGLYNGYEFPLNLAELRVLDAAQREAALAVLRMDAAGQAEVHTFFADGPARWQAFMQRWGLLAPPPSSPFTAELPRYHLKLQGMQAAPGYRDATLVATVVCATVSDKTVSQVELHFTAPDTAHLLEELLRLHRHAWHARRPLDAAPDEIPPAWLSSHGGL